LFVCSLSRQALLTPQKTTAPSCLLYVGGDRREMWRLPLLLLSPTCRATLNSGSVLPQLVGLGGSWSVRLPNRDAYDRRFLRGLRRRCPVWCFSLRRDTFRPGSKFCSHCCKALTEKGCGAPVRQLLTAPISSANQPTSSAERRPPTVPFCDLFGLDRPLLPARPRGHSEASASFTRCWRRHITKLSGSSEIHGARGLATSIIPSHTIYA